MFPKPLETTQAVALAAAPSRTWAGRVLRAPFSQRRGRPFQPRRPGAAPHRCRPAGWRAPGQRPLPARVRTCLTRCFSRRSTKRPGRLRIAASPAASPAPRALPQRSASRGAGAARRRHPRAAAAGPSELPAGTGGAARPGVGQAPLREPSRLQAAYRDSQYRHTHPGQGCAKPRRCPQEDGGHVPAGPEGGRAGRGLHFPACRRSGVARAAGVADGGREGGGRGGMESVVFIFSLIDCCALIFLSVYFVSFFSAAGERPGWVGVVLYPRPAGSRWAGPVEAPLRAGERGRSRGAGGGLRVAGRKGPRWVMAAGWGCPRGQPPGSRGGAVWGDGSASASARNTFPPSSAGARGAAGCQGRVRLVQWETPRASAEAPCAWRWCRGRAVKECFTPSKTTHAIGFQSKG